MSSPGSTLGGAGLGTGRVGCHLLSDEKQISHAAEREVWRGDLRPSLRDTGSRDSMRSSEDYGSREHCSSSERRARSTSTPVHGSFRHSRKERALTPQGARKDSGLSDDPGATALPAGMGPEQEGRGPGLRKAVTVTIFIWPERTCVCKATSAFLLPPSPARWFAKSWGPPPQDGARKGSHCGRGRRTSRAVCEAFREVGGTPPGTAAPRHLPSCPAAGPLAKPAPPGKDLGSLRLGGPGRHRRSPLSVGR